MVPSFWTMKIHLQNPGLNNTTFSEFLIKSNNISFHLKFYHGKQYHIFELWSLFATFESLKSVEFLMHAVGRNWNSKHFYTNAPSFQITL